MKKLLLSCLLTALLGTSLAMAELKIPPGTTNSVWSANQMFKAVTNNKLGKTTVFRTDKNAEVWHMYGGKINVLGVSNDGDYIVVGGGNYLPADFTPDMPLLAIYKHEQLARTVKIGQVIRNYSSLPRTLEGTYLWGYYQGFDNDGNYWIETADHKKYGIDPASGRLTIKM